MQNCKSEREVNKHSWLREVREGGEGPHWTVVPSKEKDGEEEEET
jgi:hypothetical protein